MSWETLRYPKSDSLHLPQKEENCVKIKTREIGSLKEKKILLYLIGWRDDDTLGKENFGSEHKGIGVQNGNDL